MSKNNKEDADVIKPKFTPEELKEIMMLGKPRIAAVSPPFTGVARSMVCFHNQGHNNFKVVTLTIENGVVVKMDLSDPYCQVEAIAKMEYANDISVYSLNNKWEDGKAMFK